MGRNAIKLNAEEIAFFESIVRRGAHSTKEFKAAYVLLNRDEGPFGRQQSYETISSVL